MLRRVLILTLLVLTTVLVQVTLLPLAVRGAFVPDLVIILIILVTLEQGTRTGLWLAGAGGLLVDLLAVGVPVGSSIIAYAFVAYLLGLLRPYLSEGADLVMTVLAGLGAATSVVVHGALRTLLTTQQPPDRLLVLSSALIVGAFAVLLAPLLLAVVRATLGRASTELVDQGLVP